MLWVKQAPVDLKIEHNFCDHSNSKQLGTGHKVWRGGGYKNLIIKRLILCGPPLIFLQNIHDPPPIWH